jgi:hypothetical protein
VTVTDAPLAPGHGYQRANGTWGGPLGVFWRRQKGRIARNGAVTRGAFFPWFMTNQACMVLAQVAVLAGVKASTREPSRFASDQCDTGWYCTIGGESRCYPCGEIYHACIQTSNVSVADICSHQPNPAIPPPYPDDCWLDGYVEDHGPFLASWCEACVHPIDGMVRSFPMLVRIDLGVHDSQQPPLGCVPAG